MHVNISTSLLYCVYASLDFVSLLKCIFSVKVAQALRLVEVVCSKYSHHTLMTGLVEGAL